MSRISLLGDGEGGFLARLAFWLSRKKIGTVPNNVRVLAHHPQILKSYARMEMGLEETKLLPSDLKMLVVVKVAKTIDCPF